MSVDVDIVPSNQQLISPLQGEFGQRDCRCVTTLLCKDLILKKTGVRLRVTALSPKQIQSIKLQFADSEERGLYLMSCADGEAYSRVTV